MANKEPDKQAEEIENNEKAPEAAVQSGEGAPTEADVASDAEKEAASDSDEDKKEAEAEELQPESESELEQVLKLLADKELELAEQKETVLRAQAEIQNMRRRCEQDVEKAHKYALEKFGAELLNVADNLERALEAVADTEDGSVKALVEGVDLTLKGLLETFGKYAIEQLNPEGEPFDPQVHEAMSMVPNPELEPNTVMTVIQKGYTLNGRVLRPARVIVSKGQ